MTMTATSTTDLASLLHAKRAVIEQPPEAVPETQTDGNGNGEGIPPTVTEHGEIVPAGDRAPMVVVPEQRPDYSMIPAKVLGAIPYAEDYWRLARRICQTELVPKVLRGRPEAIVAMFFKGYEMGFGPMQALASFEVIEGTVGIKPEAMRALIMDKGHQFILSDVYDEAGEIVAVSIEAHRNDWPAARSEVYAYSIKDARLAGLLGKDNWKKMPRAMLDARATAGAGRRYFADVLAGMSYTPEEIRDFSGRPDTEEAPPRHPASTSQSTTPSAPPAPAAEQPPVTPSAPPSDSPEPSTTSTSAPSGESTSPSAATSAEPPSPTNRTKRTRTPKAPDAPATDSDVRLETRKALTALIAGLDGPQQPLCRAFLAQRGYGDVTKLSDAQLQEAINIAAGWPDTCVVDEDEAVDAEVVEDGQLPLDEEDPF